MHERVVLCYGDSNTWGFDPRTKERFDSNTRWPCLLQKKLAQGHKVIEEGLNSRTTVLEDPLQTGRNGRDYLIPCLDSHSPIDLVILMLGTNDFKHRFGMTAHDVSLGIASLVHVIATSGSGRNGSEPRLLLLSPAHIGPLSEYAEFFEGAEPRSKLLAEHCRRVADECGCEFLDVAEVAKPSEVDGIHLDAAGHETLAEALAPRVRRMLKS